MEKEEKTEFCIVEGVASTWFYHLADKATPTRALCGARTMKTSIPLAGWNRTPANYHIPEKWCKVCPKKAGIEK